MTEEDKQFSSLSDVVSGKTLEAIGEMGFTQMMEIQYRAIRPLLLGKLVRHGSIPISHLQEIMPFSNV